MWKKAQNLERILFCPKYVRPCHTNIKILCWTKNTPSSTACTTFKFLSDPDLASQETRMLPRKFSSSIFTCARCSLRKVEQQQIRHKRQHVYFGQTWAPNSIMSFHDRPTAAYTHLSLARAAKSMQYLVAQISFQYSQHQDSEDIFPMHVKFAAPTCYLHIFNFLN